MGMVEFRWALTRNSIPKTPSRTLKEEQRAFKKERTSKKEQTSKEEQTSTTKQTETSSTTLTTRTTAWTGTSISNSWSKQRGMGWTCLGTTEINRSANREPIQMEYD